MLKTIIWTCSLAMHAGAGIAFYFVPFGTAATDSTYENVERMPVITVLAPVLHATAPEKTLDIKIEDLEEDEIEMDELVLEKVKEIYIENRSPIIIQVPDILQEQDWQEVMFDRVLHQKESLDTGNTEQSAVIAPIQCADNMPPEYPRLARRLGYEGMVILIVKISEEGTCINVEIEKSSGYAILDEAAVEAVYKWKFKPAKKDGIPVQGEIEIPIRFRLTD